MSDNPAQFGDGFPSAEKVRAAAFEYGWDTRPILSKAPQGGWYARWCNHLAPGGITQKIMVASAIYKTPDEALLEVYRKAWTALGEPAQGEGWIG